MYTALLLVHSWLRWAVLLTAILVLVRASTGGAKPGWTAADDRRMLFFTIAIDLQMTIGLILYAVLSPATQAAFEDMGAAMRNGPLRFWAVEHLAGMIIAVVFAHLARAMSKKGADPAVRRRRALLFTGLSLALMILSIPWPGLPNGRPLFRFGG